MPVLLDTHVWLWFAEGDAELDHKCRAAIEAALHADGAYVSLISVWEIALLDTRRRIILSAPCVEWVNAAFSAGVIKPAELSAEILVASTRLPGRLHADPSDSIIVATARALDATLITRDRTLLGYGRQGHVAVLEA